MSRLERLREYKRQAGPSGESRDRSTLDYWANRASENSYHRGQKKPKAGGPGRTDKNHVGEDDYMPDVHRVST
ncbi:hypothetical protein HL666_14840 [Bradyrhizobium sp. 83002]|uniref:hypothetical protein n=1 Tax=Bradyrhizobium aeschynomenes TaxID=2734909 RepID=UPI00155322E6|nr:hypothetical protein [Bradyrhizobium aeschynomenes]NPU12046.1 hypothetical protein [Bradyrhizobium aeschynomenes]